MILAIGLIVFALVFSDPEVIIMLVVELIFSSIIGSQLYHPMEKMYNLPKEDKIYKIE